MRLVPRLVLQAGLLGLTSWATAQTGSVFVHVEDPEGLPLPGAVVALSNAVQLMAPASAATDRDGLAEFPVVKSGGGYRLEVGMPGFARQRFDDLRVPIGGVLRFPVRLTTEIREQVEVSARRAVVDLEQTASSTRFSNVAIRDLPTPGRFYQNFLTMVPGITDSDGDMNPNVHGARSRDFRMLVGGVANVDPLTGEWMSSINMDSIEEIEAIPTGAGVEYGRAQGGNGQVLQKQGSNRFEGTVSLLYASSRLDGDGATDVGTHRLPAFKTVQPFAQISGPILPDRLWFRFSYEHILREDPVNALGSVYLKTTEQSIHAHQITWQASPRNKLFVQYQRDPKSVDNDDVSRSTPPAAARRHELGGPTWTLSWTAAQSPRLVVDSLVAYQDHRVNELPAQPGHRNDCLYNLVYEGLDRAQCFFTNSNHTSGSFPISSRDHRQRTTARSQVDFYGGRLWGMSHRIKFGLSVENERYYRQLEQAPDVTFSVFHTLEGIFGVASYRIPIPSSSSAGVRGLSGALYAEDQIRIRPNLTLTAGLRLDRESLSSLGWSPFDPRAEYQGFLDRLRAGQAAVTALPASFTAFEDPGIFIQALADSLQEDPSVAATLVAATARQSAFWPHKRMRENREIRNSNLAPRLSIAWDPGSDGKTKLSASVGRYYDKIFLAVPLVEQEPASTDLDFRAYPYFTGPNYSHVYYAFFPPGGASPIDQRTVAADLRTPYQDEVAVGFEREVAMETSIRISWIRRRFEDQLQDEDINHVAADFGTCRSSPVGGEWVDWRAGPDGVLDDCYGGSDGRPDLYTMNPAWGTVLRVGNINRTKYDAAVLEVIRRYSRNWQLLGSYTWSRAIGQAEDFDQILGDDRTTIDSERGPLAYDQTHVVKIETTAVLPGKFRLGGVVRWESGLPFSSVDSAFTTFLVAPQSIGSPGNRFGLAFENGSRNASRNPAFWTFDARLAKEWTMGDKVDAQAWVDAFNFLNDDAIAIQDMTGGTPNATRRFGRRWQVGMRLAF